MPYNPSIDDELDVKVLRDEDHLNNLRAIRSVVGEAGLTDEDMEFVAQYEPDPGIAEQDFGANLAEFIDESAMATLASEVIQSFDWDHESRKDWYEREVRGIRMLGITSKTDGGAKFAGASKAVHPMLAEACVQFQARMISEVWPAHGPVKMVTVGQSSDEKDQQASRVGSFMNYTLNNKMPGAFDAEDMAYLRLPMSGSVFKKVYHDPVYGHMDDFIPPDEFVVPYNAIDLRTAPRYTHVLFLFPNEVKRYQLTGYYRDIEIAPPDERSLERVFYEEVKDSEGQTIWERSEDQRHTFLEQHVSLDLTGFEHRGEDGEKSGLELPYVVTVDYDSQKVLSIRRNWKEADPLYVKREWFVHKKFTPGFGFYGYGFFHWIGSLTTAAAGALRALLDAAQFSNLPAGYRPKDARSLSGEAPLAPGEWRETDMQPDELRNAFFSLPYKEPSMVLFNLMGSLEELGRRFASTTDVLIGAETGNVPVGTTLARIDQGQKITSSINKRIYRANTLEYRMLHDQISEHMPEEGYPFVYNGVESTIAKQDFDGRVDVFPVADPEVATSTQRIIQSQLLMEMASQAPHLYDLRSVHRRALSAVRLQDIDEVLKPEAKVPRRGPVEENMAMTIGKPVKARADEDHAAHGMVHERWFDGLPKNMQSNLQSPLMAHMAEHEAWAYYIQMSQATGMSLPSDVMGDNEQDIDPEQDRQLSVLAAQAAQMMPKQPSPDEIEAQAKAQSIQTEDQMKEQASQAEIARKDRLTESEIVRRDAIASAEARRNAVIAQDKAELQESEIQMNAEIERTSTAERIARANDESTMRIKTQQAESGQRISQAQDEYQQKQKLAEQKARQAQEQKARQAQAQAQQAQAQRGPGNEDRNRELITKLDELSKEIKDIKSPAAAPQEINISVDAKGGVTKRITPTYDKDGKITDLMTTEVLPKGKPN